MNVTWGSDRWEVALRLDGCCIASDASRHLLSACIWLQKRSGCMGTDVSLGCVARRKDKVEVRRYKAAAYPFEVPSCVSCAQLPE